MTNKILIPVDFSNNSDNAIAYAIELCKRRKHEIDLFHVFTQHSNRYHNFSNESDLVDPRVAEAKETMSQLITRLNLENPDIQFKGLFAEGNLYERIRVQVSTVNYDAIVMGTKGASGLDALLIGSNMFDVFLNTKVPVLAIPETAKKIKIEKIGLLCNFKPAEIDVLKQAIKLYGTDFELVLTHVNSNNQSVHELDKKFAEFIQAIIKETSIDNISYVIKSQSFLIQYKEDISTAIDSVIADEMLDVLLVTKSKKSFFRKIIDENIVKRMAYQIQIPKFFARREEI